MLGTLMESSRAGQRWPSLADAVDLLAGGLRHRLGLSTVAAVVAVVVVVVARRCHGVSGDGLPEG